MVVRWYEDRSRTAIPRAPLPPAHRPAPSRLPPRSLPPTAPRSRDGGPLLRWPAVPGTWPDGDDDGDEPDVGTPVHPDDRLWRHPSELAWTAPGAGPTPPPAAASALPARGPRPTRHWALAITSGLTGAALALGVVVLFSGAAGRGADPDAAVGRLTSAGTAATTPTGLASVAEAVLPSVVRIEVEDGTSGATGGTGVVLLDDGHVLTSARTVDGATSITLVVADGTAVPAQLVGIDHLTDIAVVAPARGHADDVTWVPASLGEPGDLDVGEAVVAVGAPLSGHRAASVSLGAVAAVGRRISTLRGEALHDMIETDVPVAPSAAGGALCDRSGAVVGLTTTSSSETSGTGFATPIDAARAVAEALMHDGVVHHVWLGIEGSDAALASGAVAGLSSGGGVLVERVLAGTPAEAAGLQAGDLVLAVDDRETASMGELVSTLRGYAPGDEVELDVRRGTEPMTIAATLGERTTG